MSTWRLLGDLSQARTREEIRTQALDGWSPWQHPWNRCEGPGIVVPDLEDSKRFRHVPTYWVEHDGKVINFAVDHLECGVWRFFVPAASTEEAAFEARNPRYEGFWRSSSRTDENLPWPQRETKWPERAAFLKTLDRAEAEAQRVSYRGFSHLPHLRMQKRQSEFSIGYLGVAFGFPTLCGRPRSSPIS